MKLWSAPSRSMKKNLTLTTENSSLREIASRISELLFDATMLPISLKLTLVSWTGSAKQHSKKMIQHSLTKTLSIIRKSKSFLKLHVAFFLSMNQKKSPLTNKGVFPDKTLTFTQWMQDSRKQYHSRIRNDFQKTNPNNK